MLHTQTLCSDTTNYFKYVWVMSKNTIYEHQILNKNVPGTLQSNISTQTHRNTTINERRQQNKTYTYVVCPLCNPLSLSIDFLSLLCPFCLYTTIFAYFSSFQPLSLHTIYLLSSSLYPSLSVSLSWSLYYFYFHISLYIWCYESYFPFS